MNKLKKITSILLSMMLVLAMLAGCGAPKVTPDESATILLDIILKGDNSKMDSVQMTQAEFDELRTTIEDSMISQFDSSGISIKDETKQNLSNGILEAFKKVEYEVSTKKEDKKQSEVEISIKGIDMEQLIQDLQADAQKYASENPSLTQEELLDYIFNKEAELLSNASLKETPETMTMTLTNEDNFWIPTEDDMANITLLAMGGTL